MRQLFDEQAKGLKKSKTQYVCNDCGAEHSKWAGRCGDCGAWNSLSEVRLAAASKAEATFQPTGYAGGETAVQRLGEVAAEDAPRLSTGLGELDRVLGGGLVAGAVVLVGGDPGIGKSTLLLQMLAGLSEAGALYVTGEESLQQVSERAKRLDLVAPQLQVMAETCVERIVGESLRVRPPVMVVDSIQTIFTESLNSAPGAVGQLRESTAQLVRHAKQSGTCVFLVGHVTKEGAIAGPRVLEHMVDTVLYFESDAGSRFRVVRSVKNRFGAANEIGVFAMDDKGLREVRNPSAIFLSRHGEPAPGSIVMVTREGSRPLLVEVQALVDEAHGGAPRRVTLGLEQNRLAVLLAVAHRHAGVALYNQDVFVNVVGGIRVAETAADLAVLLATLSSYRGRPLAQDLVVFGEIGLAGEIRPVPHGEERLREAAKHGFKRAIVPLANKPSRHLGLEVIGAARITEAIDAL